ncbi:MAG: Helicase associated domain protein, partial [Clostridia bacterium]|nr:Helicase associated domain protein [Clostridia bacterium]
MGIQLFSHNQAAYLAALEMLHETGKAAIVHPTGTGKSFIGFKLCEEFPKSMVCWLSPSEYIFKTQIENLKAVSDGYEPQNVKFFTYAKLMNMDTAELELIQPDYIVLDEFHRCGAEMWGQGVKNLLSVFPNAPILGLSATAIRYLDNQRDMSDELFDGNVASEMTLGEAIVRGILNPPKYVLSVFSYRKDLERYQKRVRQAKSKAVRDAAEKYLEALRRALDMADGLDVIFDKHMIDRHGKYVVFCANYEHLSQMTEKAGEWFSKVDATPHIYTAYSDDPETSKAFEDFKKDNSDHLKLLFCIDMLNEGIHVEDVCGVILLRPTVSPIIYKQQIGRALSASKKNNAVIFDIVLNIENLYSIGAIEEEMQIATTYYRSLGLGEEIVNERFQVIDEVRDCVALFDKLNDTLTASWDLMYKAAKKYYEENGDLDVPKRYVTAEGFTLGSWINTQRLVHEGKTNGILTDSQVEKLNAIGMRWESVRDLAWEKNYAAAKAYFDEHGDLLVNV